MTKKPHIRIHSDLPGSGTEGCERCVFDKDMRYCVSDKIVGRNVRCVKGASSFSYELVSGDIKELMK